MKGRTLAAGVVGGFVLLMTSLWVTSRGFVITDTYQLLDGVGRADACLQANQFHNCGSGVASFPLLQYVFALVVKRLGGSYEAGLRALVVLNGLALVSLVLLGARLGRALRFPTIGWIFAVTVSTTALLWYAHSGFGEALAAAVTAAVVVGVATRSAPILVLIAAFAAAISKETAWPFLFAAVAWSSFVTVPGTTARPRRQVIAASAGIIAGVVANNLFNVFRYDTIANLNYTRGSQHVGGWQAVENAAAILVAPGGGLVWMAPLALAIVAAAVIFARRASDGVRSFIRSPATGAVVILCGQVIGLGFWGAPLGGINWGPRLIVPWIPAVVLLALAAAPSEFDRLTMMATRGRTAVAAGAVIVCVGLPQVAATVDSAQFAHAYPGLLVRSDEAVMAPFRFDRECPRLFSLVVDRQRTITCTNHQFWSHGLTVVAPLNRLGQTPTWLFALAFAAAVVAVGKLIRGTEPIARSPDERLASAA